MYNGFLGRIVAKKRRYFEKKWKIVQIYLRCNYLILKTLQFTHLSQHGLSSPLCLRGTHHLKPIVRWGWDGKNKAHHRPCGERWWGLLSRTVLSEFKSDDKADRLGVCPA